MFSDSDSENESVHRLTINEHYAKAFEYKKEREELEKLKLKYGSDYEESDVDSETDSESAESEDEDGEELTPAVDAAILRTLARIKRKDPDIYDKQKGIFKGRLYSDFSVARLNTEAEEQSSVSSGKPTTRAPKDKSKPVTLRQVVLDSTLNITQSRSPSPRPPTHEEEQRALRDETIAAFHQSVDDQNDDADDLLVLREKTKDELEQEQEEYHTFLEREVGTDLADLVTVDSGTTWQEAQTGKEKKSKGKKKDVSKPAKSKAEENQEFLMNYILNRGWIDRSAKRVPTYQEVTSGSKKKKSQDGAEASSSEALDDPDNQLPTADPDIDEDDFEEIVDRFESSYNFRFEEPDAATIKTYPRILPSTVRREDSTRKDARARRKERKEAELLQKREEIKRMKALKMKEIRAKLDRIGQEGGKSFQDDPALQELDLDGDWDPEAHDKQMSNLYGEDQEFDENEKPVWDDDIDIGDIVSDAEEEKKSKKKKKKKEKEKEKNEDGVDVDDMDADVDKTPDDDEWDGTEEMRKRKLDEYMDEIYGLDFNDMTGGIPTRFKYVSTAPQNYALNPVEILMATDAELNEYMGIKKFAPYRDKEERYDSKRRDRLQSLKMKLKERSGTDVAAEEDRPSKKRKGKKERMKLKQEMATSTEGMKRKVEEEEVDEKPRKTKKRRRDTEQS